MASLLPQIYLDVGAGITPSDGAKLQFNIVGSSTPKNTFTTATEGVAHANPVIADSLGVFPQIFISGSYDWVLQDKNSVQQDTGTVIEFSTVGGAGTPKVFATIALAISDTSIGIGDKIETLGYTSAGDGGKGEYEAVAAGTGTDDGGAFLDSSPSGSFQLKLISTTKNISQWGAVGASNLRTIIQAAIDANPDGDLHILTGSYSVTPTTNTNGVTVPENSGTRLIAEAGAIFTGDNSVGPLLNYRGSANSAVTNRATSRGIDGLSFKGEFTYTPGTTNVNANTFDYTIGEGVCLAVGNDNIPITNVSFYNTPACILYESSSRAIGGKVAHVYGGQLENYRFETCLYGAIFYADTSITGQYVGGMEIGKGFVGGAYKAAFASMGKFIETVFVAPVFENITMLHAHIGNFSNIEYGIGHYETGWSAASLTAQQIAQTLDLRDLVNDVRYSAIRVLESATVYQSYGYADYSATGRAGTIRYKQYNKPLFLDRSVSAVVDIRDDFSNFSSSSAIDDTITGDGSALHIQSYESEKASGGATVFKQPVGAPFSMESGQMFHVQDFINKSSNFANVAQAPMSLGGNASGVNPSALVADGILTNNSQEFTLAASGNLQFGYNSGYTASSANLYVLYSAAIKVISTSDAGPALLAFDSANKTNVTGSIEPDGIWRTYAIMVAGASATQFKVINNGANSVTFRICDKQAVKFGSLIELNDFVASRSFATARTDLTAANDYIVSINPLDNGLEFTTEYDWVAAATSFQVYSSTNSGENVGAYFEIERLEIKLISGTGVSLNVNAVGAAHWVSAYTPTGTDWVTVTLANDRPLTTAFVDSAMKFVPTGTATMKIQVRIKLRFL